MAINIHNYTLPAGLVDWEAAFTAWDWLVPAGCKIALISKFADLFLTTPDGQVSLLDLEGGSLESYSASVSELESSIAGDENTRDIFYIPLVDSLIAAGINLEDGQCYHFKKPTVLGGQFDVSNIGPIDIQERIQSCGNLQRQLNDLPDGAEIVFDWGD